MPTGELIERFRADLAALCDVGDTRLLVAVSGGGDSLALLLLAHAVLGERVGAATVDHGIRADAAAEAAFVAGVCRGLGIPHAVLTDHLPERAGRTANLSARARTLRYRLLEAHRLAIRATHIATAHHADDQLETLVMRLNRGAGVGGLTGIRAQGSALVRPLLGWRRRELADVVAATGLVSRLDPSNTDDRFDRARLRKAIAGADWLDPQRWSRSATLLGEATDALDWAAARLIEQCAQRDGDGWQLELAPDTPVEIARRMIAALLRRVDDAFPARPDELTRLVSRILSARHTSSTSLRATLGAVMVTTSADGVRFDPAPPRRTG